MAFVTLKIYDCFGKEIETLCNKKIDAGAHTIEFDSRNYPPGVYYLLVKDGYNETGKMLLLR